MESRSLQTELDRKSLQEELEQVTVKLLRIHNQFNEITDSDDLDVLRAQEQYWSGYKAGLQYLINKNS